MLYQVCWTLQIVTDKMDCTELGLRLSLICYVSFCRLGYTNKIHSIISTISTKT